MIWSSRNLSWRTAARASRLLACAGLIVSASVAAPQTATAQTPNASADAAAGAPSVVPPPKPANAPGPVLSDADRTTLEAVFAEADRDNWDKVRSLAKQLSNPTAAKLVQWLYFKADKSGAGFSEIAAFIDSNPAWPARSGLLRRAEERLIELLVPDQVIADWFRDKEPVTGEGKLRLGEALKALGQAQEGRAWIRQAWIEHDFEPARESEIATKFAADLDADTHRERMTRLLAGDQVTAAKRTLRLAQSDIRALGEARLQLRQGGSASAALQSVPSGLLNDPGLLYDLVRWHRRKDTDTAAQVLLRAPMSLSPSRGNEALWHERHVLAREAMEEGDYQTAYDLAAAHGLTEGLGFAEGEWLAGWVALKFLNDPASAAVHFGRLNDGVKFPISKARAAFWTGRATEAMGQKLKAQSHYSEAAQYPTTFYGQLGAILMLGEDARLRLPEPVYPSSYTRQILEQNELFQAVRIADAVEQEPLAQTFVYHLADTLDREDQLAILADLTVELGKPNYAVRIAKRASRRQIDLTNRSYPIVRLPQLPGAAGSVEPALILALSRQESEFNPRAISHAGALGLMQLMPSTAQLTAQKHALRFSRAALLDDPQYNATLGASHLSDLLVRFDGSYILAIAAYNAGARNVDKWIGTFGDPRDPNIDPVDWMEMIPFKETRSYVQRVLESLQVYRNRLTGANQRLALHHDLLRGRADTPPIPMAAPEPPENASPEPAVATRDAAPTAAPDESDAPAEPETPLAAIPAPAPSPAPVTDNDLPTASIPAAPEEPSVDEPSTVAEIPPIRNPAIAPRRNGEPPAESRDEDIVTGSIPDAPSEPAPEPAAEPAAEPAPEAEQASAAASDQAQDETPAEADARPQGIIRIGEPNPETGCRYFIPDETGGGTCLDATYEAMEAELAAEAEGTPAANTARTPEPPQAALPARPAPTAAPVQEPRSQPAPTAPAAPAAPAPAAPAAPAATPPAPAPEAAAPPRGPAPRRAGDCRNFVPDSTGGGTCLDDALNNLDTLGAAPPADPAPPPVAAPERADGAAYDAAQPPAARSATAPQYDVGSPPPASDGPPPPEAYLDRSELAYPPATGAPDQSGGDIVTGTVPQAPAAAAPTTDPATGPEGCKNFVPNATGGGICLDGYTN